MNRYISIYRSKHYFLEKQAHMPQLYLYARSQMKLTKRKTPKANRDNMLCNCFPDFDNAGGCEELISLDLFRSHGQIVNHDWSRKGGGDFCEFHIVFVYVLYVAMSQNRLLHTD